MNLAGAAATARVLVDPVLAVVFPSRCPACGGTLARPSRGPLCEACWTALPRHRDPLCGCGFPLPASASGPCGRCRRGLQAFAAGFSLGPHEGALKALIHELKYRGRRRVAARLAELVLSQKAARSLLSAPAVIVPVPLHPRRLRERGFNQAERLGAELARRTGLPLSSGVVRRKDTPPQTGLSAAARRSNVAGAFAVRRRAQLAGRIVVLVDDVLTTGATVRACARALLAAGAAEVRVLTAARVV